MWVSVWYWWNNYVWDFISVKLSHRPAVFRFAVRCSLWECLWSCVLWWVWSLSRPRGLVKEPHGRASAMRPQYQNSHICRAAARRDLRFTSAARRDIRETGGLSLQVWLWTVIEGYDLWYTSLRWKAGLGEMNFYSKWLLIFQRTYFSSERTIIC